MAHFQRTQDQVFDKLKGGWPPSPSLCRVFRTAVVMHINGKEV